MHILSWNIQSGKGCDGITDIYRTIDHIKNLGDFDLICLQEVARNMDEYCHEDQMDQLAILSSAFDQYAHVWGSCFSWPNSQSKSNSEFGNVTLVRNSVLDNRVHQLPMPAAQGKKQMPRVAIETVIDSNSGRISIINTHLAYHDANERQKQLERLYELENQRSDQCQYPKKNDKGGYRLNPEIVATILCGDFNFGIDTTQYDYQLSKGWIDAWTASHGDQAHSPTCGLFDNKQWPQGSHCRDFFWLGSELAPAKLIMQVDTQTDLSDHQPIKLEIEF